MDELSAAVLQTKMDTNDSGAETVGDYLRALLRNVWQEEEEFSGKRPFGNSGWQSEVYNALVKAGLLEGDEDGPISYDDAEKLILDAIEALGT